MSSLYWMIFFISTIILHFLSKFLTNGVEIIYNVTNHKSAKQIWHIMRSIRCRPRSGRLVTGENCEAVFGGITNSDLLNIDKTVSRGGDKY